MSKIMSIRLVLLPLLTIARLGTAQYHIEQPRSVFQGGFYSVYAHGADIDGSGRLDLVTTIGVGQAAFIWRDPMINGFAAPSLVNLPPPPFQAASGYADVQLGRVTPDTIPDMIAIAGSGRIQAILGGIASPFASVAQGTIPVNDANNLAVIEINGDSFDDVVATTVTAAGAFQLVTAVNNYPAWMIGSTYTLPRRGAQLLQGDFDGDQMMDIAVTIQGSIPPLPPPALPNDSLLVFWGNGNGTLASPVVFSLNADPLGAFLSVRVSDFDGDGCDDVLLPQSSDLAMFNRTWSLRILWGSPSRQLASAPPMTTPGVVGPFYLFLSFDVDNDGLEDGVWMDVSSQTAYTYNIFHNRGNRTFDGPIYLLPITLAQPNGYIQFAYADFDGDRDIDFAGHSVSETYYFRNEGTAGPGCAGTLGRLPYSVPGSAWIGSPRTALTLENGLPGAPALLGISLGANPSGVQSCGIGIDFPGPSSLIPTMLDISGRASIAIPIPSLPGLSGARFWTQWAIADLQGGFIGTTTNVSFSETRMIVIW